LENEKQVAIADMTEAGNKSLIDNAVITGDTVSDLTGVTADDIKKIIEDSGVSITELLTSDSETIKDIVGDNTELIDLFDNTFAQDLDNMTTNAGNFESYLQDLLDNMEDAWEDYQETIEDVADKTGTSMDELAEMVDKVSESTDRCTEAGLEAADAMWDELSSVQDLSVGYAELAQSVYKYIDSLRELATEIGNVAEAESGLSDNSGTSSLDFDPTIDYSKLMYQEYLKGNAGYSDAYSEYMEKRDAKIAAGYGNYGSATTARIDALLQRADAGDPDA
jgi:methyl-accepting chemotaxis protein